MNASSEPVSSLGTQPSPPDAAMATKMELLKEQLDNFTVIAKQGELVGEVRDVVVDRQQLFLVIVQPDAHSGWRFVRLDSRLVKAINVRDRTVSVDATQLDISYLPAHLASMQTAVDTEASRATASVVAPVSQLPAPVENQPTTSDVGASVPPSSQNVSAPGVLEHPSTPKAVSDAIEPTAEQPPEPLGNVIASVSPPDAPPESVTELPTEPHPTAAGELQPAIEPAATVQTAPVSPPAIDPVPSTAPSPNHEESPRAIAPDRTGTMAQPSQAVQPSDDIPMVSGVFDSPKRASQVLDAIAQTIHHRCKTIRIEVELEDASLKPIYQEWLDHYSLNH